MLGHGRKRPNGQFWSSQLQQPANNGKRGGATGPCRTGSTWQQSLPAGISVVAISASGTSLSQSCYVRSDAVISCSGASVTGVTPAGAVAPDTPGTPTVIGGNGQATITITPPTTGGTPATYTVTANPGGATCTITSPATSCDITGLTNGTTYTFAATAHNASGTSKASSQSTAHTIGATSTAGASAPSTASGNQTQQSVVDVKDSAERASTTSTQSMPKAGGSPAPVIFFASLLLLVGHLILSQRRTI